MMKSSRLSLRLILVTTLCCIGLASCSSSSEFDFLYDTPLAIYPDTVYSNASHRLDLGVKLMVPDRGCWLNDNVGYAKNVDTNLKLTWYTISATIKRRMTTTSCQAGYDTLHNHLIITFDNSGSYRLDFPQADAAGNLITKSYQYTVQ